MAKKKTIKPIDELHTVHEPLGSYEPHRIKIFKSFQELNDYELQEMANLSPEKILKDLRNFINTAYGMHGYNPDNLPKKHTIKIIRKA
jgi:hypothetical protein